MKGAAGALLTRGANDFDRALLLAQLLDRQGITAKLAYGTVSKDQARELLASVVRNPDAAARMLASVPHLPAPSASPTFEQKEIRLTFEHGLADRRTQLRGDNAAQLPLLKPLLADCAVSTMTANSRRVWVQAEIRANPAQRLATRRQRRKGHGRSAIFPPSNSKGCPSG
jgi:hypothetical protein